MEQGQPYKRQFRADYEDFLEVPEFVAQRHEEAPPSGRAPAMDTRKAGVKYRSVGHGNLRT